MSSIQMITTCQRIQRKEPPYPRIVHAVLVVHQTSLRVFFLVLKTVPIPRRTPIFHRGGVAVQHKIVHSERTVRAVATAEQIKTHGDAS
ncbi:MAG: hypothetical protein RL264_433 [Bacteroidota bacterium]